MSDGKIVETLIDKILDDHGYTTRDVTIKPITSEGANYTTSLFNITVTSPGKETLYLFAKSANVSDKLREEASFQYIFKKECDIYEILLKAYDDIQDKYNIPAELRLRHPKFYGKSLEKGKETLVFEDLTKQGYVTYDRFLESLDWENAAALVSSLAKFHALSFVVKKEHPEIFNSMSTLSVYDAMGRKDYIKHAEVRARETVKLLSEDCRIAVTKFLDKIEFKELLNLFRPVSRKVIMHGDFRTSNIMFKKENGKLSILPVDYQASGGASVVSDLLYLISLNTNKEFRSQYLDKLIDLYYEKLRKALKRMQIDVDMVYPRSLLDFEYKTLLPLTLFVVILYLPGIFVEPDLAVDYSDSNMDAANMFTKPGPRSLDFIEKYVRDLIRWGAL